MQDDDFTEPDDWGERDRTRAVVSRLEETERQLFERTRAERWGSA
jgi:hypothetical protein